MIVYVVTLNNNNNEERHITDVFLASEDVVSDYICKKNRDISTFSYYYDYCAMELKEIENKDDYLEGNHGLSGK